MMKTKTLAFISMLGIAGTFASCSASSDELGKPESVSEGKGTFKLNLTANADFSEQTRALNEADYKNIDNYTVELYAVGSSTPIDSWKYSDQNSKIPYPLNSGMYTVRAYYGSEQIFSQDDFLVEGRQTITINSKDEKTIELNCTPTCSKLSVAFDAEMATYYSDYNLEVQTEALKGLTKKITKDDKTNPWYMAISETGEDIKYTINLTTKEGYINTTDGQNKSNGVITGTISMARNKSYSMTITPEYQASPTEGKLKIKITIKSETEDKPITYDVPITWI